MVKMGSPLWIIFQYLGTWSLLYHYVLYRFRSLLRMYSLEPHTIPHVISPYLSPSKKTSFSTCTPILSHLIYMRWLFYSTVWIFSSLCDTISCRFCNELYVFLVDFATSYMSIFSFACMYVFVTLILMWISLYLYTNLDQS